MDSIWKRPSRAVKIPIAVLSLSLALWASVCWAGGGVGLWAANGLPVNTATGSQQEPEITGDGSGGAIVVWLDTRHGNYDVYAQRLDSNGTRLWNADGVAVCTASGNQFKPRVVGDGSGGAIIAWEDRRSTWSTIYVQRVDSSGMPRWDANGVGVYVVSVARQYDPQIASDGSGGAIVVWTDDFTSSYWIHAQRFDGNGSRLWGFWGVQVTANGTHNQFAPHLAGDGAGGAVVAWQDYRSVSTYDIYAQRVNSSGVRRWAGDTAVCTAGGNQFLPRVAGDGSGGAIITWEDVRSGPNYDVYAQRVNSSGTPVWAANGVAICTLSPSDGNPQIVGDGSGGAIIAWHGGGGGPGVPLNVYAQRVNSSGITLWTSNGVQVSLRSGWTPQLTGDGFGGAIMTWQDQRSGDWDIYAQHLNSGGAPQWTAGGEAVCMVSGSQQEDPKIAGSSSGSVIITWQDDRSGNWDVYAQRVMRDTTPPGNPTSAAETHGASSNVWQNTVSDPAFTWSGATDDLSGVKGYRWYFGDSPSGVPVTWTVSEAADPGNVASGTYYLRLSTEDNADNVSSPVTLFTFRYDGNPPYFNSISVIPTLSNSICQAFYPALTFSWEAGDDHSGVAGVTEVSASGMLTFSAVASHTVSYGGSVSDTISYTVTDNAGWGTPALWGGSGFSFCYVDPNNPGPGTPTTPTLPTTWQSTSPTITISGGGEVFGAPYLDHYDYQVWYRSSLSDTFQLIDSGTIPPDGNFVPDWAEPGTYRLRVRAVSKLWDGTEIASDWTEREYVVSGPGIYLPIILKGES